MRRFFALFAVLAALFVTRAASAQAAINVVNETSLPRYDAEGKQLQKRPVNLTPEAVSLQDCLDDQRIRFSLQLSGFEANASLQAWAANTGQDCKSQVNRESATRVCWQITGSDIPLQLNPYVDIPVRTIMSGVSPFTPLAPDVSVNVCGKVNLANISVQFLYFSPGNLAEPVAVKAVAIQADTVGPSPPSGLRASPGNTRIHVEWTSISGSAGDASASTSNSGTGLTELTGIKVYCDRNGSIADGGTSTADAATTDAGATDTGSTDGCFDVAVDAGLDDAGVPIDGGVSRVCADASVPGTPSCTSGNLTSSDGTPTFPNNAFNDLYQCGSLTGNTGSAITATAFGGDPLVNGERYAVAVAATDRFGNVGQLSSLVCETPEPTTDFWDQYRDAGGDGGGGCTSAAPPGAPVGTLATLAFAASAGVVALSRRRRKPRSR